MGARSKCIRQKRFWRVSRRQNMVVKIREPKKQGGDGEVKPIESVGVACCTTTKVCNSSSGRYMKRWTSRQADWLRHGEFIIQNGAR